MMWHNISKILNYKEAQKWELKEIYKYEQYKKCSQVAKRKLESRAGGLEEMNPGRSTADSLRYHCATMINKKSIMVQALGSRHVGSGELESCPTSGKMSVKFRA